MKFKNTLEIVTKDIQDIEKLVSNLKNNSGIPRIELDLALSKLRNVYDILLMLRETPASDIPVSDIPKQMMDTEVKHISGPFLNHETKPEMPVEGEPSVMPPAHGLKENIELTDDILNIEEFPVTEKKPAQQKKSSSPVEKTIGDKFAADQSFMNEKLGEKIRKTDISSLLQSSPIKTITASLGVNDKFFYIRELFNGDPDIFRQTIRELDNSLNFNSAYTYLMDNFSWDMESEAVQKLLNLVRRKFISPGNE